jgi:hypothetical protein
MLIIVICHPPFRFSYKQSDTEAIKMAQIPSSGIASNRRQTKGVAHTGQPSLFFRICFIFLM